MKKNLILKIKCLLCGVLLLVPLFPCYIFSESVGGSSPIIGVNITYIGYDGEVVPYQTTVHFDNEQTMWRCTSSHSTMGCQVWESQTINGSTLDEISGTITTNATSTYTYRLYQYEFIFDKTYVGSITFNGNHPGATTTTTYYVNGNRLVLTDINLVTSFTIGSYNLTYAPLETISQLRQWNIPFESYSVVLGFLQRNNEPENIATFNYFNYPVFNFGSNKIGSSLLLFAKSQARYFAFLFNMNIPSNNQTLNNTFDVYDQNNNQYNNVLIFDSSIAFGSYYLVKFHLNYDNAPSIINLKTKTAVGNLVPIYYGNLTGNMATDFALQFGYSNKLLDDLHIIAQGTAESTSSSNNLEESANDIVQNSSTMFNFENQQNQNMNNALQNINTNYDIGSFGSSFLYSANWVKNQFDNITNSTPFGSVLSFSLLLGLALLIIGKVYK